ncbi:hypothetical protein G1H11_08225 [Phytoactinopolyspora alkaliphila]|uniref:Uncharacterized protein n=1 Tax=Phytoactinopolyspora alkaliphila TaxID=1783498 RepID=A0A6N9YK63_9ACTN|nr:hypothetical protein [Phytoactinopolyspora alkaliphila]NED95300.1 hypothetical protein [Phytoactinopolyspora alkaliphila]
MVSVRHRRRLTAIRVLAVVTPVLAAICAVGAWVIGGSWPMIAAGIGATASVVLAVTVFRLERRLRVDVATVRAEQAAEYSETHARYSDEHRQFTNHMVGLLDAASERLGSMRNQLNKLEIDVAYSRSTRPNASTPSDQLARWAEGAEWNDLWPDLSDAPTVVDLVAWEDKHRDLLPEAADVQSVTRDEPEERTA